MKECPRCGLINPSNASRCDCGYEFKTIAFNNSTPYSLERSKKNENAGFGVPVVIMKWNWGAFLLTWIWGLGNNVFISLLTLIPVVGFIMPFILGFKGNEWAWKNKRWNSIEHFNIVQRKWAIAGILVWSLSLIIGLLALLSG